MAFFGCPSLAGTGRRLGRRCAFAPRLDRKLFELAVLVVAAEWRCSHEWAAHSRLARDAGVAESVLIALRNGETPEFAGAEEKAVFRLVHELVARRSVADETYTAALDVLGEEQLTELLHVAAYYLALAAMLNGFAVQPPAGFIDPWAHAG